MEENIDKSTPTELNQENAPVINTEPVACPTNKCDKFYRVLSALSFVGMVVLFILYFTGKGNTEQDTDVVSLQRGEDYSIAFVNSDSLMSNYKLFDLYKTQLENRKKAMEEEIGMKAKKFENDVTDFQKKVKSYSVTSEQAQKMEADLMKRQEQLLALKEEMSNELLEVEYNNQTALFDSIINTLTKYNKERDFDYVLGYSRGSGILLANEKYDITPVIIELLNKDFDAENKED